MANSLSDDQRVIELEAIRLVLTALVLAVLAVALVQFPDGHNLGFGLTVIAILVLCYAWVKARYRSRVARSRAGIGVENR